MGLAGHEQQSLLAEEFDPTGVPGVGLGQTTDEGIAFQAIGRRSEIVEAGQEVGGVDFRIVIEAAASGHEAHHQQVGGAVQNLGQRQIAVRGQVLQHPAFDVQDGGGAVIHLDCKFAVIGQPGLINFAHAAAAQRA